MAYLAERLERVDIMTRFDIIEEELKKAANRKEVAEVLRAKMKRKYYEALNGVQVLDIAAHMGLIVGDPVNFFGYNGFTRKWQVGFVSHFDREKDGNISPIMVPQHGFGYATHRHPTTPPKIIDGYFRER